MAHTQKAGRRPTHHTKAQHQVAKANAHTKPGGSTPLRGQSPQAASASYIPTVLCQPNTTFYINAKQRVPYDKVLQLQDHYAQKWSDLPVAFYKEPVDAATATAGYPKNQATVIKAAVQDVMGHALPGNTQLTDQFPLTAVHNMLLGMMLTGQLTGDHILTLQDDFTEGRSRTQAREAFNANAFDYRVPVAMLISGMPTSVGNFEGVCVKIALPR
jgi:hypothetical protein